MVQLDLQANHQPLGYHMAAYYKIGPKLFGDAALSFANHFFNFVSKSTYANPQKPDLRFISVNKRTARWQNGGISGMEAHIVKDIIRFVHNGSLILSMDISIAKKLQILPIQPHKLVVRDVNNAEDVDEICYHFGNCVTDLHVCPNVPNDLAVRLINQFRRVRDLTIQPAVLTHPDINTLSLSSLHIESFNQLRDLESSKQHHIKSLHVHNPITPTIMNLLETVTLVSPLVLHIDVHKNLMLNNLDLALHIRTSFPTVRLLRINVIEYQTNYLVTQAENTAEVLASCPLVQQFHGTGVYVQMSYDRYLDLNRRSLYCHKSAILSTLHSDDNVQVKAVDLQIDFQHYQIETYHDQHSVTCNLYFQGNSCCGQHSKYLL